MSETIVIQMFKKAEEEGVKITDLARQLDIPQNRIYQWKSSGVKPKADDAKKIESWLQGRKPEEVKTIEIDLGASVRKMEATTSAILAVAAEILAKVSDRSVSAVRQEVEMMVNRMLDVPEQR